MVKVKEKDEVLPLHKELKRRNAELKLYKEVLKDPFSGAGFSTKMWNFLDILLEAIDADLGMAFLINSNDNELGLVAVKGLLADELKVTTIPFGSGIAAAAAATGEPHLIGSLSNDVELFEDMDVLVTRSSMAVPLNFRGRVSGVIQLVSTGQGCVYTKDDLDYFVNIADEFREVSEKSYVFSDMKETIEGSASFIEASCKLSSTLDACEVREYAVSSIRGLVSAASGDLFFLDEEAGEFYFKCAPGGEDETAAGEIKMGSGEGVAGWVVRHKEPVIINDVSEDGRFELLTDRIRGTYTKSIVCVPIFSGDRVLGVLQAINKKNGRFVLKDRKRLEAFAKHISNALGNAARYNALKDRLEG